MFLGPARRSAAQSFGRHRLPVCVKHNQMALRRAGLYSFDAPACICPWARKTVASVGTTWQKPPFQGAASCRGDFLQASSMKASLACGQPANTGNQLLPSSAASAVDLINPACLDHPDESTGADEGQSAKSPALYAGNGTRGPIRNRRPCKSQQSPGRRGQTARRHTPEQAFAEGLPSATKAVSLRGVSTSIRSATPSIHSKQNTGD